MKHSSRFLGVSYDKNSKKWHVRIGVYGKRYHLGLFNNEKEAGNIYKIAFNKLKNGNFKVISNQKQDIIVYFRCMGIKVSNSSSKYIGVSWDKNSKKWHARIRVDNKKYSLGLFDSEKEAAIKYNTSAKIFRGDTAKINNI